MLDYVTNKILKNPERSIKMSVLQESHQNLKRDITRRITQIIFQFILVAAILFIASGTLDWLWAWIYLLVSFGILIVNMLVLVPKHPELVAERSREKENTKVWDRILTKVIFFFTIIGLIVAGLDKRFSLTHYLASWFHISGLILYVLGQFLFTWSMTANEFFATTVRLQKDRGQKVAEQGPYQYVRHPGYLGMILSMIAFPIALGTYWVFIPYGIGIIGYIVRTAFEDNTLTQELVGYSQYKEKVKYRLIPGIW
jgi:protein-S-isoprenylcysteine O-methyltransferase Ste14